MRARGALVALAVVVLAGCSGTASDVVVRQAGPAEASSSSTPSRPGTTTTMPLGSTGTGGTGGGGGASTGTLNWTSCGAKLQCSKLTVPLDYSDPSKGTISLYLKRRPAGNKGKRIGSLLVNPGGPGIPGTELVDQANLAFSNDLLSDFDIVGWDPRGTGESSPVDCVDDLDPYFGADPTPDTPEEKQHLIDVDKQFDAACEQRSGKILPYISTQDTARDMDEIRQALGEDKISYFGFSYGSELGAVWATMFPQTVRAMVIDGASDPNSGYEADLEQQVVGLERTLDAILDDCAKDTKCAFHHDGNPGPAFDALAAKLDTQPLKVGNRTVGQGAFYYAVIEALYDRSFWPTLTKALAAAENGDGSGLLDLYDEYLQRNPDGTYSNAFEGLVAINCLDDPGPTDPNYPDQIAPKLKQLAPRLGEEAAYGYMCTYWPVKQKPPITVTAKGAGPVVVVGTTGDPVTPIESTRNMAKALEQGVLVTVTADRHTGYGVNNCIVQAVDDYLIDKTVPKAGLVCS